MLSGENPTTYDYLWCINTFFISPFTDNSTVKDITFPSGNSSNRWIYWFNQSMIFTSSQVVKSFNCPFNQFPVFILAGSMIPLHVQSNYTGLGTKQSQDYITLLITRPSVGIHKEEIHEFESSGYTVEYNYNKNEALLDVFISAHSKNKYILLVSGIDATESTVYIGRSTDEPYKFRYEDITKHNNHDEFWMETNRNGAFYETSEVKSQLFVKITESASNGIHIRIKGALEI